MPPTSPPTLPRRRLLHAAACAPLLSLAACGGGGGGGGGGDGSEDGATAPLPPPAPGAAGPTGTLVYRNGSSAAIRDVASGRQVVFEPGSGPLVDPGLVITPERELLVALAEDNAALYLARHGLDGRLAGTWRIARELPLFTSSLAFSASGHRVAFSLSEIPPGSEDRRDRTLVFSWPAGEALAAIDGYECPVWAGDELLLRHTDDQTLHRWNAQLQPQGPLAGIVLRTWIDAYTASRDGRFVVWADGPDLRALDRTTGQTWVAAHRISDVNSPCLSPDGRWLAVRVIDMTSATFEFWVRTLHIVPFAPGHTSEVDSALYGQRDSLVEIGGRMDWVA